ncbi:hypothetical protein V8E36_002509 [Tilletia maclaganii]
MRAKAQLDARASRGTQAGEPPVKALLSSPSRAHTTVSVPFKRLIELTPAFTKLGVAGITKTGVTDLAWSIKIFGTTLIAKPPSASQSFASSLAQFNAALACSVAVTEKGTASDGSTSF